jgi:hypothetical protein
MIRAIWIVASTSATASWASSGANPFAGVVGPVGGSSYQMDLKSIELFASEIKPLVEKVLGPLENFRISTIEK